MGKTVPSFRMALEDEIYRWRSFRKALHSAEDQEAFDVMMDMARNNAMAGGAACNPIVFEPMVMSILLAQKKQLDQLECELNEIRRQRLCAEGKQSNPPST